jgi:hypothetical protein
MPAQQGTGPVVVYRALPNEIGRREWPVQQVPQQHVRQLPAFKVLAQAPTVRDASVRAGTLLTRGSADVAKAWTEVVYESVRQDIAPDAPSRLDGQWAFADPLEAFAFSEKTADGYVVFEARVGVGVPWRVVEMGSYFVPDIQLELVDGLFIAREDQVVAAARHYWLLDRPDTEPEVLVGGEIELTSSALRLIPWLKSVGIVE